MDTHERIRNLAYQLWEQDGCPCDRAEVHWFHACEIVRAEDEYLRIASDPNPAREAFAFALCYGDETPIRPSRAEPGPRGKSARARRKILLAGEVAGKRQTVRRLVHK